MSARNGHQPQEKKGIDDGEMKVDDEGKDCNDVLLTHRRHGLC